MSKTLTLIKSAMFKPGLEERLLKALKDKYFEGTIKNSFKDFYKEVKIDYPVVYTSYVDENNWKHVFRNYIEGALIFETTTKPDYCLPINTMVILLYYDMLFEKRKHEDKILIQNKSEISKKFEENVIFYGHDSLEKMLKSYEKPEEIMIRIEKIYEKLLETHDIPSADIDFSTSIFKTRVEALLPKIKFNEVLFKSNLENIKPIAILHRKGENFREELEGRSNYNITLPIHKNLEEAFESGDLPRNQF